MAKDISGLLIGKKVVDEGRLKAHEDQER